MFCFKENPGGEFRKSYHGYPNGYAQLIHSPTQWVVEPMQIDTHNRDYGINDEVGLKPSFLPKTFQNNMTDLKSGLSPLIECPCTDRITKSTVQVSSILTNGKCKAPILNEMDCRNVLNETGLYLSNFSIINDSKLPSGWFVTPMNSRYVGTFNTANASNTCGDTSNVGLQGTIKLDDVSTYKI